MGQLVLLLLGGAARKRIRQLATLRGAAYFALSLLVLALLLIPNAGFFDAALARAGLPEPGDLQQRASTWLPLSLLIMCLYTAATAAGPAFHLSATERNFLLAAPIPRKDILLYKFCMFVLGALLSAALLCLLTTSNGLPAAIFVGTFVTFTFAQLFSVCTNMALAQQQSTQLRRIRWGIVGIILAIGASFGTLLLLEDTSLTELVSQSRAIKLLTIPFLPYSNALTATTLAQVGIWGGIALLMNLALLVVVIRLDAANPTTFDPPSTPPPAADASTRGALNRATAWLMANNPIAGQQAICAIRGSGKRVLLLFLLMPLLGPALLLPSDNMAALTRFGLLFVLAAYVLPRSLVFDFRSELAKVGFHKSLPLAPWKVCVGQLAIPVLISSALIWLLMGSAMLWMEPAQRAVTAQLAPFVPFANALLFAADNLLFLLFPKSHIPAGRVDFDFMGRAVIELLGKTTLLTLGCSAAIWTAITATRMLGLDRFGLIIVALATLAAVCTGVLLLLSLALRRFDTN